MSEAEVDGGQGGPEEGVYGDGQPETRPGPAVVGACAGPVGGGEAGEVEEVGCAEEITQQALRFAGGVEGGGDEVGDHNQDVEGEGEAQGLVMFLQPCPFNERPDLLSTMGLVD